MPHSRRLTGSPDQIDSAIREEMVTDAGSFEVPPDDHFKPQLSPEQIMAIDADKSLSPEERARRIQFLAGLSIHSQWGDWTIEKLAESVAWIYRIDYETAKRRVEEKKKSDAELEKAFLWKLARWAFPTIFGASLIFMGQYLAKRLLGQ